jgi:methylmalonyl-CoA mutase
LKSTFEITREMSEKIYVIPPQNRYLSEIAESNRHYDERLDPRTSSSKLYGVFKQ